ncbi:MAG: gamma-glutamyltransferase family protein [Paracoccaceae bacterium]
MRDFQLPGRSPVVATSGMCATSHPLAAQAAVRMLQDGGNAVDAAITAAVLLGICEPLSTGIGGDCFVLLKPAGQERIVALNGSGRAPAGLRADAMRGRGLTSVPPAGVESVTMPGAVDAFCRLSEDWGKVGLAECLAPAIHYAEAGVPVAPRTAYSWSIVCDQLQGEARGFYLNKGSVPVVGDIFRHPKQAEVLRRIAKHGQAGFYQGEVAQDMVSSLNAFGGSHTLQEFNNTACDYCDPISATYKGTELVEHPPNGQGAAAILLANIMGHFDLTKMDPFGAARIHLEAEATKLAYDARDRFIADPRQTIRLGHMLAPQTAASLAALIDSKRVLPDPRAASENIHKETVYLTVVDKDRMAVSMICSIYHGFGSGLASCKFGILFHNRGCGFTLEAGHPNEAAGGKRPLHTLIPGMLKQDGRVTTTFGVMGGSYQGTGHVRFLSNLVDFGMDPQSAIDGPRSFAEAGLLQMERGNRQSVCQGLEDLGHKVIVPDLPLGGAQAILIDDANGTLQGASDPRKDGAAIGY